MASCSTKPSRSRSTVRPINQSSALIFVSVLRFYSTVRKPVEFSQPPPFFLGLHLVTSQLLLPDYWHPIFAVLCTTACGGGGGGYDRSLDPGAHGGVRPATFLATECVLDQGLLTLVCDPSGFNVPNLRTCEARGWSSGRQSERTVERT